ncbi:DUF1674 domain-containing protein [uncultured Tateyamaria sp.]|uniref:DUF1674 domain-containing protein n=1 Tax=uncultured Tateyamaria sp. TaxID=455651 RepID=UPI00260F3B95|nr:DUF1674 domain-containing protein [uncultured Tateyamaria sp.]
MSDDPNRPDEPPGIPTTPDPSPTPAPQEAPQPDLPPQTPPAPTSPPEMPQPMDTDLPPAAQRALSEAKERRKAAQALELPTELGGRDGPEPVRYGDWEKKGLAIDF